MPVSIKITGQEKALAFLKLLGEGAAEVGRTHFRIVSGAVYSHWINEGFYASGRPGRRKAGAAKFMERGLETMERLAPESVARNLEKGPAAVRNGLAGVAGEGTKQAQAAAPKVSGNLRSQIHSTTLGRGG